MATLSEDIVGGRGYGYSSGDGGGIGLIALLAATGALGNNRRDNFDRDNCRDCVTNESLNQQTLGDIKAAIPLAESALQLALATQVADLTAQNNTNTQTLLINQFGLEKSIAAVDTNVDRQSTAIQVAVKDSERNIIEALNSNRISDLEQQLTVSQLRESEQRQINRENVNSHNVTVQVNQQQAQAQLQFQQLNNLITHVLTGFNQIARATNGNVIVGNAGATTTGAQTANPTNVNA